MFDNLLSAVSFYVGMVGFNGHLEAEECIDAIDWAFLATGGTRFSIID